MTLTLVVSPQLLGGVFPWGVAVTCLLASAASFSAIRGGVTSPGNFRASMLDWALALSLGWSVVQAIPLPVSWIAAWMPESADAWRANASLLGKSPPKWIPLSLDPGATRLEVAKGAAIMAVFMAARVLTAAHRRHDVLKAAAASTIVMACVAFAHKTAGASAVFGVYTPVYASSRLLAPLMNENHLGGFMALGAPIAIGLSLDADKLEPRLAWAAGAFVCVLAGVLSFSRAGLLTLTLGIAVFATLYTLRQRRSHHSAARGRALPALALGAVLALLVVGVLEGDRLIRELSYRHNILPKFQGAVAALSIVERHPLTGVGRGAFSATLFNKQGTEKRFFHAENLPAHWASEWGLPVTLLLLITIIMSIAKNTRLRRSRAHLGGVAGLIAIGVHQLADFSLELVGVAVVAAAALGTLVNPRKTRSWGPLRTMCAVAAIVALGASGLALSLLGTDVFTLESRAQAALAHDDHEQAHALVEKGLTLHPVEPMVALRGAQLAVHQRDPSAGRWLNRTLSLAPQWSAPRLLTAQWLFSLGKTDQALGQIRTAEILHPGSANAVVCSLLRARQDPSLALRAAPDGPKGAAFLDRAAQCLPRHSLVAAAIDDAAMQRNASLPAPLNRHAHRLMAAKRPQEAIELLRSTSTLDSTGRRLLATAYAQVGDLDSAIAQIAPLAGSPNAPADVLRTAASLYIKADHDDRLQEVASKLRGQTGAKPRPLSEVDYFLGKLYESHHRLAPALEAFESSYRASESRKALFAIARVSAAMGHRQRAVVAYRRLCRLDGGQGNACTSAQTLEKGTRGDLLQPRP